MQPIIKCLVVARFFLATDVSYRDRDKLETFNIVIILQMVVPKRAAVLLDRLMVALHHALEDEDDKPKKINQIQRDASYYVNSAVMPKGNSNFYPTASE